jgi:chorismate mutase
VDDVAAAYFTATDDLNAEFPALAARQMGWTRAALMCAREMNVEDGAKRCIRVLLLVNTDKTPEDIQFVYLRGASNLRSRGMEEV